MKLRIALLLYTRARPQSITLDVVDKDSHVPSTFPGNVPPPQTQLRTHSFSPLTTTIMASAAGSGLTRRRGAGAANTSDNAANENESSRVSSPVPTKNNPYGGGGPETSYESGENGHRIAFDPRDISESAERSKQPKLTLMEEVLLMGLKDKQGYLSFWNDNISYALRGCIVIELAFRGRISMQKGSERRRFPLAERLIEVVDDTLTGEVLLDEALKMMKSSEKMSVSSWIDLMSGMWSVKVSKLVETVC